MAPRIERWILSVAPLLALPLAMVSLFQIFFWVPTEKTLGLSQRIFYWHVPSATVFYAAFIAAGITSVVYLRSRRIVWDHVSHAAVSVGMVFASIVIATGSIWAHTAWNTWWTPDSRLTTFLVLWLVFASYLLLRVFARDNEMAPRYAAVLAIVGAAIIPLVVLATRLFHTIHPQVIGNTKGGIDDPRMVTALLTAIAAFVPLVLWLWALKFAELRTACAIELLEGDAEYDRRPATAGLSPQERHP